MADTAICKSCNKPFLWLTSPKSRQRMPVNVDPAFNGNIRVDREAGTFEVLTDQLGAAQEAGEGLHLSHFATCPGAAAHRRKK